VGGSKRAQPAADVGVIQHVNPRLKGTGLLSSGKQAAPPSAAAGLGALQATRLQNSLGAYKRAGGPAGAVRRGPSAAAAAPAAPAVRGSGGVGGRCQHRPGGRCTACAGALDDHTHVEFSVNPLAARSALAFAPTTTGVGGSTALQPTRRSGARTAPTTSHRSQPGATPSGRGRGIPPASRPLTQFGRGLRAGSPDSASVSSATSSSSRSSGSSTHSERAAVRARARARLDISALRRKSRVELRAVPASAAQPRTASDVAAGLSGQRARGAPAAAREPAAATAVAPGPPHGDAADASLVPPMPVEQGGQVDGSATAGAGIPAGPVSQRRAVNLGAGADKRDGTAGSAAPGLRDLRSYRATSVRSVRTALG
jgi:hypothetical protein